MGRSPSCLRILVVVVDKPAGWLSVPSHAGTADPRPVVGTRLQTQLGGRLWPVHRLDEDVSGLLLFARSAAAHRGLCSAFNATRSRRPIRPGSHGTARRCQARSVGALDHKRCCAARSEPTSIQLVKPAITDVLLFAVDANSCISIFARAPVVGISYASS